MIFDLTLDPLDLFWKGPGILVGIGSCNGSAQSRQHLISWANSDDLTPYGVSGPHWVQVNAVFIIGGI